MEDLYYPCTTPGCQDSLHLKEKITGLEPSDIVTLECPSCGNKKKHSVREIIIILHSNYNAI